MFNKESLEKFFNLKFNNWIFFIPFFGTNSYYKLFDLLVEYNSFEGILYYKTRLISRLFYLILNLFSIILTILLFVLIFVYRVHFFSFGENFIFSLENKHNYFYDYNIWFPNIMNVVIYSFIAFFGFFLNAFWAKFVIYFFKKFLYWKYDLENKITTFEFLQNFNLEYFVNSVLVDTENCKKKKKKSRKICWKYQHNYTIISLLTEVINSPKHTRRSFKYHYIKLRNSKEISEFDWVVTEVQNYYWFYTFIFASIFNKNEKNFNRKKFFYYLFKILFFYILSIWILLFSTIFVFLNHFLLDEQTFWLKISALGSVIIVIFMSVVMLESIFIEWTYRRIKKRFFDANLIKSEKQDSI
ncbi:Uncharacterised protein [Mesomycoplasma dispar]|uniref:Uncharacterized protein n=1 Tax=Mesomycoplasma dispar TaxID=86660 RepID=A0AAJ5NQB5_9BACT|nr:hypothetical protein MDIS_02680 [Mesomycoplasma dispar]VEU62041.1 Uncharacterised protein [Mesomycoplasma dispar]